MASPTRWTWVRVSSGSWWWTGKPGVLQSMGLQRVRQLSDWTELILGREGMQRPGRNSPETIVQPWGWSLPPSPKGYTEQYLWAVLQKPPSGGWSWPYLPTAHKSQNSWNWNCWWCWLLITSPSANQKNVHELITSSSLNNPSKTPRCTSPGGDTQFWGH